MKINVRIKVGNITLFFMVSQTQTLTGVTNKLGPNKFFLMWDLENCSLNQATKTLQTVQKNYGLSTIFVVSDHPKSYRAYCFSTVTFPKFLEIICATEYCDWNFIRWSVVRAEATLRTSQKQGRPKQKLVAVLESHKIVPIPKMCKRVVYDTGIEKKGKTIIFDNGLLKVM